MLFHLIIIFFTFFSLNLTAQNIDFYLALLEEGKIDEVKNNLSDLFQRYPDNAGNYFLDAITTENGDTLIIKGHCENKTHKIGFGEVKNKILP